MKKEVVKIAHLDDYKNEHLHLRETAYPEDIIIQKLLQYDAPRLEHLLKLFYYRDISVYIHAWMNTVYKCAIQTYKDSKTNKWPAYQLLFENLWLNEKDAYQARHDGYVTTFNYTRKKLPKIENLDWKSSAAFCENYFD